MPLGRPASITLCAVLLLSVFLVGCRKEPPAKNTLPAPASPLVLLPTLTIDQATERCCVLIGIARAEEKTYAGLGTLRYGVSETNGVRSIFNLYHAGETLNGIKLIYRFDPASTVASAEARIQQAFSTLFDNGDAAYELIMKQTPMATDAMRHIDTASHGMTISYVYHAETNLLESLSVDLITRAHQQSMLDQHFK